MSRGRVLLVAVLGALAAVGLIARAAYVGIAQSDRFGPQAMRQAVTDLQLRGRRGDIVDRDGRPLAWSVPVSSLGAHRRNVTAPSHTAQALAPILKMPFDALFPLLSGERGFAWLKRWMTRAETDALLALGGKGERLPDEHKERLATRRALAKLSTEYGVELAPEARRYYIDREHAAHILGFVDHDERGIEGVEKVFDETLRGRPLSYSAIRDRRGFTFVKGGVLPNVEAGAGNTVVLTLHRALQWETEAALARVGREAGAKAATAVVIEPSSGEILALATWPRFNPNARGEGPEEHRRNRAVVDLLEPGSTMKPFSIATAIEAGLVQPDSPVFCHHGVKTFGSGRWKHTVRDVKAVGAATVTDVIRYSSNICTGLIGERLGPRRLYEGLARWFFGQRSGVELPGEARGLLRLGKAGSSGVITNAYGYGLSVTALQLAQAYAAMANDGEVLRPRLVRELRSPKGEVLKRFEREVRGRAVSAETARKMRAMMALVTQKGGTGTRAAIPGYEVAGKTGTALKPGGPGGRYTDKRRVLFAGFAPADAPRLAAVVVVEEPSLGGAGGKPTGGRIAAPVWREIVESGLRHLGVPARPALLVNALASAAQPPGKPSRRDLAAAKAKPAGRREAGSAEAESPERAQPRSGVPDLRGLGVATALREAARRGLTIEVEGSGRAVKQHPAPGAVLAPNGTVRVTFTHEDG